MKFWIAIFSAALFAGGTCLGVALQPKLKPQQTAKPAEAPSYRYTSHFSVERFVRELDLTPDQDARLDEILGETQRDIEAYSRSIRSAHERSRERIMEFLSDDQKKKLETLMSAEREKRAAGEADKSVKIYKKLLDLTDEEARGFRDAVLDAKHKKIALYAQPKRGDHEELRGAFREIREAQNAAIQKALAPEKYQRYLDLSELER
jgi:Spy/CpxP family protein refolding chaperone